MPSPDFLAAGRSGKHDFPRYLVTIALVITAFILGQLPLMGYLRAHGDRLDPDALAQFDFAAMGFDPNIILLFMLLPFAVGMAALLAGVRYFHMRPLRTVLTGRPRLDRSRIAFAAGLWLAITAALELVAIAWDPGNYTVTFAPLPFVLLLAVGLLFLPIQTTFEEVMMRGYLFQGIARLAPWRWIPVVITSLLFGLLHGLNPEIGEFGAALMMPYYIGVGVVLAVTVLMDEGLELAIGHDLSPPELPRHTDNHLHIATAP